MYNGLLNVSILVNKIKPFFNFEMDLIGISTTVDFKNEVLVHLENELNYSLGNNKPIKLQNIERIIIKNSINGKVSIILFSDLSHIPLLI